MQLDIHDLERAVLSGLVEQAYRELKAEIYRTETDAYKGALKERESVLVQLLHKLGSAAPIEPAA